MENTMLEPSVSESPSVLPDELPRLSNSESTAILRTLQDLRKDIRHDNKLLNNKLERIQETLASLESRLVKLEQLNLRLPEDEVKAEEDITGPSQSISTEPNLSYNDKPKSGSVSEELSTTRLQGASGAILIVAISLPMLFALLYFE